MKNRREWQDIFNVMKQKILYPGRLSLNLGRGSGCRWRRERLEWAELL